MVWETPEVNETRCGLEVTSYSSAEGLDDSDLL
ncbi:pyrroloquinoline quinone precursor peptide PqqA [Terrihabitans sp. B22-R8]